MAYPFDGGRMLLGYNVHGSVVEDGLNAYCSTYMNWLKLGTTWGTLSNEGLTIDDLDMDANGYPQSMPLDGNGDPIKLIMRWGWMPAEANGILRNSGNFKLHIGKRDGSGGGGKGRIKVVVGSGGATLVTERDVDASLAPVVIDFSMTLDGERRHFELIRTDPDNDGSYLNEFAIVHADNYTAWLAGDDFDPKWIEDMALMDGLRTLKDNAVNIKSTTTDALGAFYPPVDMITYCYGQAQNITGIESPSNPTPATDRFYTSQGAPFEVMVAKAVAIADYRRNTLGNRDPYIFHHNWPVNATEAFLRTWMEYFRDNTPSYMYLASENGNEVFNPFESGDFLQAEADTRGGTWTRWDVHGKKTAEIGALGKEILGDRHINGLGTWYFFAGGGRQALEAAAWLADDPDNYVAPHSVIEVLYNSFYPWGGSRLHDQHIANFFYPLTQAGKEMIFAMIMEDQDPNITGTAYPANQDQTPVDLDTLGANDRLICWPAFRNDNVIRDYLRDASTPSEGQIMLGSDVHNYVRLTSPNGTTRAGITERGPGTGTTWDIEIQDEAPVPGTPTWHTIFRITDEPDELDVEALVTAKRLIARGFYNGFSDRMRGLREILELCVEFGCDNVMYEWGPAAKTSYSTGTTGYDEDVELWREMYESTEMKEFVTTIIKFVQQQASAKGGSWFMDIQKSWDGGQFRNGQFGAQLFLGAYDDVGTPAQIRDAHVDWQNGV